MIAWRLAVLLAALGATAAQAGAPLGPFTLTDDSMRLVRDGQAVRSLSVWRIVIRPVGRGWRVEGQRLRNDVSAPPAAASLAAVARMDPESGRLPLRLDAQGRIADPPPPIDPHTLALIHAAIQRHFAQAHMTEAQRAAAQPLMDRALAQRTEEPWPPMLFRPRPGTRHDRQTVNTGAGMGTIDRTEVARVDRDGWLRGLEITLVTEVGGVRRSAHELWTMVPAGR